MSASETLETRVLLTTDYVFSAASASTFAIQNVNGNVQVSINGGSPVLNQPLVDIGTISINGSSGNDTVNVYPLNGLPSLVITGGVVGAIGDVVTFQGGNATSSMGALTVDNVGTINVTQTLKAQSIAVTTDKLFVGNATTGTAGTFSTTNGGAVSVTGGTVVSIGTSASIISGGNVTLKANSAATSAVSINIAGTLSASVNAILRSDRLTDADPATTSSLATTIQSTGKVLAAGSVTSDSRRLDLLAGGEITSSQDLDWWYRDQVGVTINTLDTGVYYGTIDAGIGGI